LVPKAILFDMDGVLVNSEPIHEKAQEIVCQQYGLDVPKTVTPTFKGWTETRVYEYISRHFGTGSATVEKLIAAKHSVFASLADELQLMDGAMDLLQYVNDQGLPLGLVTSATKSDQQRAFRNLGLISYFSSIVTVEDVTYPKPDPEPYIKGADGLGFAPLECLVIEDSQYGIQSAMEAGCHTFGVATTFSYDVLEHVGAHKVFHSIRDIELYLRELFSLNTP